ncbi:MAG: restriction endonuclease subunit S [Deltaproteobacteria bacterium]|nr:restriction endonuclease subunit S [Deltaproteobacteria bacterium]
MAGTNWPEYRLSDLCESIDYGYTVSAVEAPVGPKFLRITDIVGGFIDWRSVPFCHIPDKSLPKYRLNHGDIVIARTGATTGFSGYISNPPYAVFASYLVRLRVGEKADPRYIAYFLKTPVFWDYIKGVLGDKSAQPNASAKTITQVKLRLPPFTEQRAISHILGTLDDKIELNRRMNETLEGMARAIFKSWFVDFDPVRAKADGRHPVGMDAETARLFPDSFEDSALGKIPKGWRVGTVGDDFNLTMGQSPPGSTYNEVGEGLPFFQGKADFGFRYPSVRVYCTAPTRLAKAGDTLVSVRAPVGDINMALKPCSIGRGVAAVRHKSGSRSYTYYAMRLLEDDFARFEAEGTVFGSINKKDFLSLNCIIPHAEVVDQFEQLAYPLDQLIENNEKQLRALVALRDALLPKLLSGQIRVKEVSNFLGGSR